MKSKFLLTIASLTLTISVIAQQDIQFSQYMFNMMSVNPAYAGYKGNWNLNTVYRQQWLGFSGAPKTGAISFDGLTSAKNENVGIGGEILWEQLGPQSSVSFYTNYAYRIRLDNADAHRLCLGIAAGFTQSSLDGTKLISENPGDPNIPLGNVSAWLPDARFGVYYYGPNFYAGASLLDLFSLNRYRKTFYESGEDRVSVKKATHMYLTIGTLFKVSPDVKLRPSLLIKEDFKAPTSVDVNVFALYCDKLWVGASYRTGMKIWSKDNSDARLKSTTAAGGMVEYYVKPTLRVGYAYDFATNGLAGYQKGSHELSLGIELPGKRKSESIESPRYF